uniref:DOCKER domain-containing protein n=1 Tax=Macrostomum lignano TaxID=282301 RepID=A0A1I8HAE2_9PLAT
AVAGCAGRLHSQAMVALAGQAERLSASPARLRRFEACLRLLRRLADGGGSGDLGRLCDSLLAVLRTTAAFALHRGNPEMCVDLHWRLANSYSHTPSLRLTYLRNMAERHAEAGHLSEAAFCAFAGLSPNIEQFEQRFGDDLPQEERDGCSPEGLADLIQQAADLLARAERYELVAPCLRPALAFHEARRDYARQAALYEQCAAACKAVGSTRGKRFLETFYRVGLYGDLFEEKQVFVYKEPGLTRLAELADRLRAVYEARFGADKVTMLTDSGEVDDTKLESGRAYVQITYVQAETSEADGSSRHFVLETPFTRSGERHGSVEDQWRRRTRLTAEAAFPTVVKRLRVIRSEHEDLSPLAVAVLELRAAAAKIRSAAEAEPPDMKRLQMVLQGCLATQVRGWLWSCFGIHARILD